MAIKGKKKHKSTKKARPAGPKREIVVPKTPLLSRRWFQNTILAVIVAVFAAGLGYGFGKQSADTEAAASATALRTSGTKFGTFVRDSLEGTGDVQETSYQPFPEFAQEVENPGPNAAKVAKDARKAASDAFDALNELDLPALNAGFDDSQLAQAQETVGYLGYAMALYTQAATRVEQAMSLEGAAQQQAFTEAKNLTGTAGQLATLAYTAMVRQLIDSDVIQPEPALPPGVTENLPPGTQPIAPTGGTGIPQAP